MIVILDVEEFIKEVERQLHNTENYKRLNHNPTTTNNDTLYKIIKTFHKKNLINKNMGKGPKIESPKSLYFYLNLKLHKVGVPGRAPETLKYWIGVQWGHSYLMGRRFLFSLGWQPF